MDVRTAYLVLVHKDGNVSATADLSIEVAMETEATVEDIKSSIVSLARVIDRNDIVDALLEALKGPEKEDVSGSIRKALNERGIM